MGAAIYFGAGLVQAVGSEEISARNLFFWRLKIGEVAGFPIFMHPSILLWGLAPFAIEGINYERGLSILGILWLSVLFHELAHALSCRWLGFGSGSVTLWFLGGYFIPTSAERSPYHMPGPLRWRYSLMILAGCLANLLLAGAAYVLGLLIFSDFLLFTAQINLSLAALNLLPIPPLDGGIIVVMLAALYVNRRALQRVIGAAMLLLGGGACYAIFRIPGYPDLLNTLPVLLFPGGLAMLRLSFQTDDQLETLYTREIQREEAFVRSTSTAEASVSPLRRWATLGVGTVCLAAAAGLMIVGYNAYNPYSDCRLQGPIMATMLESIPVQIAITSTLPAGPANLLPITAQNSSRLALLSEWKVGARIDDLLYSPDNSQIAIAVEDGVYLTALDDPAHIQRVWEGQESSMAFSPDSSLLAVGSRDGEIALWELHKRQSLCNEDEYKDMVRGLAFSPDGLMLASSSMAGDLRLHRLADGRLLWAQRYSLPVTNLVFSPDQKLLAVSDSRQKVHLLHLQAGRLLLDQTLETQPSYQSFVMFSPDQAWLLVGGDQVLRYNLATGRFSAPWPGISAWKQRLSATQSGDIIIPLDRQIGFWPISNDQPAYTLDFSEAIRSATLSSDGRVLAVALGQDGLIQFFGVVGQ